MITVERVHPISEDSDFRVGATAGIGVEHVGHYPKGLSFVDWVGRILTQQQWHHWSHTETPPSRYIRGGSTSIGWGRGVANPHPYKKALRSGGGSKSPSRHSFLGREKMRTEYDEAEVKDESENCA